jgi:hypothetical protein
VGYNSQVKRGLASILFAAVGCSFNSAGGGGGGGDADGESGAPTSTSMSMSTSGSADGPTSGVTGVATGDSMGTTVGAGTTGGLDSGPDTGSTSGVGTSMGSEGSGGSSTGAGAFDCTDVLYVAGGGAIGTHDQPFYDVLMQLGATVTVVQDDLSVTADADGRCLVVISASCAGASVADKFRDVAVPVVTWEYAVYDDMAMTGTSLNVEFGAADPAEDIDIVDAAHPMAAGLSGTVTVVSPAPGRLSWGAPAAAADIVATISGVPGQAGLFGYAEGEMMVGLVAPAARVGFPALTAPNEATINADGRALFEAALRWAVP